ncbi:MAG TPA: type III PLP-dependent enzyme [Acidimicrobiales bacterium]|nr:type III PLP-dependent enzyme [Acidimicrobiales bacterium]
MTPALRGFLDNNPALPTPFLALDLDVVEHRYRQLEQVLPMARVLYAVKANPAREILERLAETGSCFDVASPGEIDRCLKLGIDPSRLAYGNTIKKERDIAYAFYRGITTFTVDADAELEKVARQAPGATVYVRLATDGKGADWPLSRKFGCDHTGAVALARKAHRAGMSVGLSFHVGSQQRDVNAWDEPLATVANVIGDLTSLGVPVAGVNLGGGLPSRYREPVAGVGEYGGAIRGALERHMGAGFAGEILIEPGRYLVGDAGLIETEVVLISQRGAEDELRWVYLDIGMFNGLTETLGEAIRYRVQAPGCGGPDGPVVLAGPSCDSADVLYERSSYRLPWSLQVGDHVRVFSTGAYTSSYSSVWFNGFEPLRCFYVTASQEPEVVA